MTLSGLQKFRKFPDAEIGSFMTSFLTSSDAARENRGWYIGAVSDRWAPNSCHAYPTCYRRHCAGSARNSQFRGREIPRGPDYCFQSLHVPAWATQKVAWTWLEKTFDLTSHPSHSISGPRRAKLNPVDGCFQMCHVCNAITAARIVGESPGTGPSKHFMGLLFRPPPHQVRLVFCGASVLNGM
jgi:hypothetical protein